MRKINLLAVLIFIAAACVVANAQVSKPVSDDARSSEKIVKGAPFFAEAVTESVQTLADGTKITRRSASKIYRDNEGRYRRENGKIQLGVPGENIELAASINILDPVAGTKYSLDTREHIYHQSSFKYIDKEFNQAMKEAMDEVGRKLREQDRKRREEKRKQRELNKKQIEAKAAQQAEAHETNENSSESSNTNNGVVVKTPAPPVSPAPKAFEWSKAETTKAGFDSKEESLGARTIEGVSADGTRTTTVIPAGKIGNDRDINIVYERWYSPELQLTVLSRLNDPRLGEQTFRLLNISRENPPLSLFVPSADYKKYEKPVKDPKVADKPSPEKTAVKPKAGTKN